MLIIYILLTQHCPGVKCNSWASKDRQRRQHINKNVALFICQKNFSFKSLQILNGYNKPLHFHKKSRWIWWNILNDSKSKFNQFVVLGYKALIIFIKFVCYNFFVLLIIYQGYVLLNVPIIFTGLLFIIDQLFIGSTIL